jgi:copper chaperone CopZ
MKNSILGAVAVVLLAAFLAAGCGKSNTETVSDKKQESVTHVNNEQEKGDVVTINLPSIQCSMCKKTIEGAVKKLDGVQEVKVSVKEKTATVTYDKAKTDVSKIEDTITAAGYDANTKTADKKAYDELHGCCKKPEDQKL